MGLAKACQPGKVRARERATIDASEKFLTKKFMKLLKVHEDRITTNNIIQQCLIPHVLLNRKKL